MTDDKKWFNLELPSGKHFHLQVNADAAEIELHVVILPDEAFSLDYTIYDADGRVLDTSRASSLRFVSTQRPVASATRGTTFSSWPQSTKSPRG